MMVVFVLLPLAVVGAVLLSTAPDFDVLPRERAELTVAHGR